MAKFMTVRTALCRLIEDEAAPVNSRCHALRQLDRPPLALLRRLLVETKRLVPVPANLKAIAALAYAKELAMRKLKPRKRKAVESNSLGIV
jgi:hypothetical protein